MTWTTPTLQPPAFAKAHGPFILHFNAAANYVRPDDAPWTLELDPPVTRADGATGWMGFTAAEAIGFAADDLARLTAPSPF